MKSFLQKSAAGPAAAAERRQARFDGDAAPDTGESGLHGRTLLHAAAANGRVEALEELLGAAVEHQRSGEAAGRCLNARDAHGDTAVIMAARGGHLDALAALLEAGADPNAVAHGSRKSAMHAAADGDEKECLELLLAFDADPTLLSFTGHAARTMAERRGFLRTAAWLRWAEADYRTRHPKVERRRAFRFTECRCSFCSVLREVHGDRTHPRYAVVGAHREVVPPGYTALHDPKVRHLIARAFRRIELADDEQAQDGE